MQLDRETKDEYEFTIMVCLHYKSLFIFLFKFIYIFTFLNCLGINKFLKARYFDSCSNIKAGNFEILIN